VLLSDGLRVLVGRLIGRVQYCTFQTSMNFACQHGLK